MSGLMSGIKADPFSFGKGLANVGFSLFGGRGGGVDMPNPYDYNPFTGAWQMQQMAVDEEARLLERQGDIALEESMAEGEQVAREGAHQREQQALNYQHQGVQLDGSPMLVLEETRRLVKQEVDAILRRGNNQSDLNRRRAMITRNEGRASLLGQQAQFGMSRALYNVQQAQARQSSTPGGSRIGSALDSLGGLFGGGGGGSSNTGGGMFGNVNRGMDPYGDPRFGGLGMVP
jgi:hypothetical protein